MVQNLLEKFHRDKKLIVIMLIGLIGAVMLIFLGNDTTGQETENHISETKTIPTDSSTDDIEKLIEEKLSSIISQINGAGNTKVVVSLGSMGEYTYAENVKKENDNDSSSQDSEYVIYESQDGGDSGLIISVKSPEIAGVAIVCEGGDSSVVKSEITKLVTSLFGIGSDRVYVGSKAVY